MYLCLWRTVIPHHVARGILNEVRKCTCRDMLQWRVAKAKSEDAHTRECRTYLSDAPQHSTMESVYAAWYIFLVRACCDFVSPTRHFACHTHKAWFFAFLKGTLSCLIYHILKVWPAAWWNSALLSCKRRRKMLKVVKAKNCQLTGNQRSLRDHDYFACLLNGTLYRKRRIVFKE